MLKQLFNCIFSRLGNVRKKFSSKKLILDFHNLVDTNLIVLNDTETIIGADMIDISRFNEELEWLDSFVEFVTLDQLFDDNGINRRWQIAITFDDGYANNLRNGLPVCEKYNAPMHWFVSTNFSIEPNILPWWDVLRCILKRVDRPITVGAATFDLGCNHGKICFFQELSNRFKRLSIIERDELIENLRRTMEKLMTFPENGMARVEDIKEAARSPFISFGGHTHTHPNLALCSEQELTWEINEGRRLLREWSGQEIRWFAYPFGKRRYLNMQCRDAVKKAGFDGALTTEMNYVKTGAEPFDVPRLSVDGRWNMNAFKARVLMLDLINRIKSKPRG